MGFTYTESYSLPVWQRIWFIERISEEIKKSNKNEQSQSRAMHQNAPDHRAMQGRSRQHVPAKLRRFT
jgi:hypothetical protein